MTEQISEIVANTPKKKRGGWSKWSLYRKLVLVLVAFLLTLVTLLLLPTFVMLFKDAQYSAKVEKYYQDVPAGYLTWCDTDGDSRFQDIERTTYHTLNSGKGIVHGRVSIELGRLVFRPQNLEGSCAFYGFAIVDDLSDSDTSIIAKELNLKKVFRKKPRCSDREPYALGYYALDVRGYAMSNDYLTKYNPNHYLDGIEMSRYRFDVHVHSIERVYASLEWTCPIAV